MDRWSTFSYIHFAWPLYVFHTFSSGKIFKDLAKYRKKMAEKVVRTEQYTGYWTKSSQSILPMAIFYDSNSYLFYAPNLFNPPRIDG